MHKRKKERVIVYGLGAYFEKVYGEIQKTYEIVAYVDRNMAKEIENKEILTIEDALEKPYEKIIISILDIQNCYEVIGVLINKYRVDFEKIILGVSLMYKKEEISYNLKVDKFGYIVFCKNGLYIAARNIDEFNNIYEIFNTNCYGYFLEEKEEIVLDIGMNIGGAALFFADKENVKKVYGYEPFLETYKQAQANIASNIKCMEKIECFNYGISNTTEYRNIIYNRQMSCGQSTLTEKNDYARKNYVKWKLISQKDDVPDKVKVRDIKDVLEEVYEKHKTENIILKIDCEGEEYNIVKRIEECQMFKRVSMIMMEWHYNGNTDLLKILRKNQYAFWNFTQTDKTGLIYAIKLKKEVL